MAPVSIVTALHRDGFFLPFPAARGCEDLETPGKRSGLRLKISRTAAAVLGKSGATGGDICENLSAKPCQGTGALPFNLANLARAGSLTRRRTRPLTTKAIQPRLGVTSTGNNEREERRPRIENTCPRVRERTNVSMMGCCWAPAPPLDRISSIR